MSYSFELFTTCSTTSGDRPHIPQAPVPDIMQGPSLSTLARATTGTLEASMPSTTLPPTKGTILQPLRYQRQIFPDGRTPLIAEVPAHFDVTSLKVQGAYSLHTDPANKERKLSSPLLEGLDAIKEAHHRGVPLLWTNRGWARQFDEFIFRLVDGREAPTVIEVHPAFRGSGLALDDFLDNYAEFESRASERYSECRFVLENRSGSKLTRGFMVEDADSILALGQALKKRSLKLGIALDLAQMFTAEYGSKHPVGMEGVSLLERLDPIREQISTLHLWGRGPSGGAHSGGLDTLFDAAQAKEACLVALNRMLDDGRPRSLVVEVSRAGDLVSVLNDLSQAGFQLR